MSPRLRRFSAPPRGIRGATTICAAIRRGGRASGRRAPGRSRSRGSLRRGRSSPAPAAARPVEPHGDVVLRRIAVHDRGVPPLGVADVVDAHVVVRAPEERHVVEPLARAEDVARRRLSHALRHDPVLHADALAGVHVGPPRDVSRREDPATLVSSHSSTTTPRSIESPACSASAMRGRTPTPMTTRSAARRESSSSSTASSLDARRFAAEVEVHSLLLVQRADEVAELVPHHALERHGFRCDDVDLEPARA